MTTTHTPGPWYTAANVLDTKTDAARIYANDTTIASVKLLPEITTPAWYEAHANAKLIAAAPDLLKALQMIEEVASGRVPLVNNWVASVARAAIAKATGQGA